MAYRYTNTDKWNDTWFSNLKPIEKLLFNYVCDNCDIAGFIEINLKRWAVDIGTNLRTIEGASKGLARGLILSNTNDCYYLKNFLKHQKNLPLNPNNKAHCGIMKRFELYRYKFDIKDINEFIEGASKGLPSPTGNGNGNGNTKEGGMGEEKTWRNDFKTYLVEMNEVFDSLISDEKYIKQQEKFHPGVDVKLSLQKAKTNFWGTEAGWKHKKNKRHKEIDWKSTFTNAIDLNKVYKPKDNNYVKKTEQREVAPIGLT